MPRGRSRTTPVALGGYLDYPIDEERRMWTKVKVGSAQWFTWLATAKLFFFQANDGGFTARRENKQRGGDYWIGYKRHGKRLYRRYIGKPEDVTQERLYEVWKSLRSAAD